MSHSRLIAYDKEMLSAGMANENLSQITSLRVGARLLNTVRLDGLVKYIALFPSLDTVCISDDWVSDEEIVQIKEHLNTIYPTIHVVWVAEGMVAGRHGR